MSRLLELQEMLQDTSAMLARLERAVAVDPSSLSLSVLGASLRKRQQELEAEFLAVANELGVDVCSYRMFGEQERTTVASLTKVLSDFQALVTVVYDAIKGNRAKDRMRTGAEAASETAFGFGYTFAGSLGVVLTLPSERLLVGESYLDESVRTIFEMTKADTSPQILAFAKRLGTAPIRAVFEWARDHSESGLGAEIHWRRDDTIRAQLLAQKPEFERLYQVISITSEEKTEEIEVEGQLIGADIKRRSFHFLLATGEEITGKLADTIGQSSTVELPKKYRAKFIKTVRIHYSTEQEETSYLALRLEALS